MASNSGVRRLGLRWSFGICILCASVTALGATRQNVKIPSNIDATAPGKTVATRGSGVIHVPIQEGEYIEAAKYNRRVPIKVIKTIDYSIPRTINQAKGILKGNLAQIVIGGVIAGSIAALDWVMEDGVAIRKKVSEGTPVPDTTFRYEGKLGGSELVKASNPYSVGTQAAALQCTYASFYKDCRSSVAPVASPAGYYYATITYFNTGTNKDHTTGFFVYPVGTCTSPARLVNGNCVTGEPSYAPITNADIDTTFSNFANSQDAEWLKGLLRESCQGSQSPEACMQSLRDQVTTTGPASVTVDKTVSTGTYLKPDGTYGTTRTEVTTNYNIKYGPTYFDFSEQKATTTYKDGQKTSDETTGETDDVTEEKPAEEDKEDADPCVTGCDGPAYTDLYQPTDKTKEGEIDSYSTRVKNIPIMQAVIGLFDVDAGASACPVWEAHYQLEVWGHSSQIDLVFDYHCLPWFVDLRIFVQTIVMIGFVYIAIRIGLL